MELMVSAVASAARGRTNLPDRRPFTQAEQLLAEAPPSPTQARALAAHAFALVLGRRTEEAKARCEEALRVARAVGARTEEAWALRVLVACLWHLGELDRTISVGLEARRVAEEAGDAETLMTTYVVLVAILEAPVGTTTPLRSVGRAIGSHVISVWNAPRAVISLTTSPSAS
jgi:hypothetical protein